MLTAVTLLPALLAMWGGRIRPARPGSQRRADSGLFAWLSRVVQRRALVIVAVVAVPLVVAAVPFLHAHYQNPQNVEATPVVIDATGDLASGRTGIG